MELHPASVAALGDFPLFEGLSRQRLDAVAAQMHWHAVDARQAFIGRLAVPGDVYFLISGRVRVTACSAGGRQVNFRDVAAGHYFGELAAIDGKPRAADVVALVPSRIAALGHADFARLLREEPCVAMRLLHDLARSVRALSERVFELSTMEVGQRLEAELLRRFRASQSPGTRGARLEPAPTHEALAGHVSTGREQVTRALNALIRQGVLAKERGALVAPDVERLERSASAGAGASAGVGASAHRTVS
ncbi:Crp/Fnr family transcriptional regulator [Variovorax sp. RCC_210]|uniref:Crp/Fnr family transcriptional regulator n=1 Tax=Variovorax sp. RCC_210 TaxID=3239217 RepID=UPI003523E8D9